jgi:hypothetical protein
MVGTVDRAAVRRVLESHREHLAERAELRAELGKLTRALDRLLA